MVKFSDGEMQPRYTESLRGGYIFIVQSTNPPSDNLMELLTLIDAAKRASAKEIVAVIPYFGYARQDRKDKSRVSLGAKLMANLLTVAGITRLITIDLHADQIQGFFDVPVDNLYASAIFLPLIEKFNLNEIVLAAPDVGSSKRVSAYAKYLGIDFVICNKQRKVANEVDNISIIGSVKNKHVILLDDMIDTGGTIVAATEEMLKEGAISVRAYCTHPILSGKAYEKINASRLEELVVTDTIKLKKESDKIKVVSVSKLLSEVIEIIIKNESISSLFLF